jgi:hypothetical protein
MHAKKWLLLLINIVGGTAVLGSYVYGFRSSPDAAGLLWGGVPEGIRPLYTTSMFLAAAGYFAFTTFILQLRTAETRVSSQFGFGIFNVLYAAILIPSALWMPLTLLTVEPSALAWLWLVRIVLAVVGMASLGLLFALLNVKPRRPAWLQRIAVLGSLLFCFQTVILDAIVWVVYFH